MKATALTAYAKNGAWKDVPSCKATGLALAVKEPEPDSQRVKATALTAYAKKGPQGIFNPAEGHLTE